jgi:anthranilate phosphoribosyltransferase
VLAALDFGFVMQQLLAQAVAGHTFDASTLEAFVDRVLGGEVGDVELASFLTSLAARGETADEIAGTAAALRGRMTRITTTRHPLLDTCGTGGDRSGTFNISTAAAIVTAAAGQPVAKHGNRAASSKSGSADVLRELGVNIEAPLGTVERCLNELGLGFCFAPLWHGSMKHVGAIRKQLGFPTIFNCVGPLSNPAGADFQLIGVGRPELRNRLAEALLQLKTRRAVVVWGTNGLDEVSLSAPTEVSIVDGEKESIEQLTWTPRDFGLEIADCDSLLADGPHESAAIIRTVLAGQKGAARDIVLLNAAASLWVAGKVNELPAGVALASAAIDSGQAANLLEQLGVLSFETPMAS